MTNSSKSRSKILWIIVPLAVAFLVLLLLMPKVQRFSYDYKRGEPWRYETLVAEFDFPVLKTEEELLKERENLKREAVPYYVQNEDVPARVRAKVSSYGALTNPRFQFAVLGALEDVYSIGILPDNLPVSDGRYELSDDVLCTVSGKQETRRPFSEVYTVSSARDAVRRRVVAIYSEERADSLLRSYGINDIIEPSLQYDQKLTDLAYEAIPDNVSPTSGYRSARDVIITSGETVTAELQQVLDSYRTEYNRKVGFSGPGILIWAGTVCVALAIVVLLYLAILFANPLIFDDRNRFLYLLMIFLFTAVLVFGVAGIGERYLYMVPFTISAIYLVAFFKRSVVFPVYFISLLPLLIFVHNGIVLFTMFLVAGGLTVLLFPRFSRGWRQFIMAGITFAVLALVYLGFRVITTSSESILVTILYLALGSFLSVAGYPLIYLFEIIFNLVSNNRLEELCDTNSKALRDLSAKAPGTYQHCQQVMNMADAATRAIGGNVLLVRAGALYHDLGKMLNPLCFVENEGLAPNGVKYHEGRPPKESAAHIIRHVTDGMTLAEKYHLPKVVREFIQTHHGNSNTGYFYSQFIKEGGDPADADEFYYPGPRPWTKEQTILMLCDTVEAASRTIKETTPEAFSEFVEKMCQGKMGAGQFDNSDLTIRELSIVKATLKEYLIGVYHQRIEYPK